MSRLTADASVDGTPGSGRSSQPGASLGTKVGLFLLGLVGIVILMIGIIADFWVAVVLWTTWTGLVILAYQHRRTRPVLTALALVIIAGGVWGAWMIGQ